MTFEIIRIILIVASLVASSYLLPRYRHIPAISFTLLGFIAAQVIIRNWTDLLFLVGVGFVLTGINLEFIRILDKLEKLETTGNEKGSVKHAQ